MLKLLSNASKILPYIELILNIDTAIKAARRGEYFSVGKLVKVNGKTLSVTVSGTEVN